MKILLKKNFIIFLIFSFFSINLNSIALSKQVFRSDSVIQIISLAQTVAESMKLPFKYQWYGDPDHRSYQVSYKKIFEVLGFLPNNTPNDGVKEIASAIKNGRLDPDDPKTITVNWYAHLTKNKGVEI